MLNARTLTADPPVAGRVPLSLAVLVALFGACRWHEYEARPLEPKRSAAEFTARQLDSPELVAFARANLPAEEPFPPALWDLGSLTQAAFFYRRELDVARAELEQAIAGIETASARPNPTLVLDTEAIPAASGSQRWVLGGVLDLPIETANKRGLRKLAAEERSLAAEIDFYRAAWDVHAQVFAALAELTAARAELRSLGDEEAAGRDRLADLSLQLEAGRISRLALAQAEDEAARLALDLETARNREVRALASLAQAVGVPHAVLATLPIDTLVAPDLPAVPAAPAAREIGLTSRCDLRRSLVEYAITEAELRLEVARQYPDFRLGPGTSWDQGDHKYILGFSVELPLFDHNEGPIAEAEARRAAAEARFLALQERAIGAIEGARLAYAGALRERAAASAALATAQLREERLARSVAAGAAERGVLLEARVGSAQLERLRAAGDARALQALGELELQLQRPLAGELDLAPVTLRPSQEESGT